MKTTKTATLPRNNHITYIVLVTAVVLLIPLAAMQFTDEVKWSLIDFVTIGALLLGTGLAYELAIRRVNNSKHRAAIAIALVIALVLVWVELAVGIFGTPFAGS